MSAPTLVAQLTVDHLRALDFWRRVELGAWGPLGYCWTLRGQQLGYYSGVAVPDAVTGLGRWVSIRGHRVAVCLTLGRTLTADETVDHLCRNTSCVKPTHLEVVTLAENIRRGAERRRSGRR